MENVVTIKFGSHLYGTNTPESDLDYKSIHIPPGEEIILQRVQNSVKRGSRSKADGEKNQPGDIDNESYSLQRYLDLLLDGQTVAIDMLFAPDSCIVEGGGYIWRQIQKNRHRFLTKKSAAFVGYCRTQANKYGIKGSRVAAAKKAHELFKYLYTLHGPVAKLRDYEADMRAVLDEHTQIVEGPVGSGSADTVLFFECCDRKVCFNDTLKQAESVYQRIYENYGDRARQAQSNEGADWKALSHAVRVGKEALELLGTGKVTFPLVDAAHILDIKKGRVLYSEVAEEIEQLLIDVEKAALVSTLPDKADRAFVDEFVLNRYSDAVQYFSIG